MFVIRFNKNTPWPQLRPAITLAVGWLLVNDTDLTLDIFSFNHKSQFQEDTIDLCLAHITASDFM